MVASDIIAICSGVVALFALGATFWQAWLARQHNRLSVRPLLAWHISRDNNPGCANITFSVRNLGLGPAVIRTRYFARNGTRFVNPDPMVNEVDALVGSVLDQKIKYHLYKFGLPGTGSAIPSQGEFVVANIQFPGARLEQLKVFEEFVAHVTFHIEYESMYGESFQMNAT